MLKPFHYHKKQCSNLLLKHRGGSSTPRANKKCQKFSKSLKKIAKEYKFSVFLASGLSVARNGGGHRERMGLQLAGGGGGSGGRAIAGGRAIGGVNSGGVFNL